MNAAFDIYNTPEPDPVPQNRAPVLKCGGMAGQEGGGVKDKICFLHEELEIVTFMGLMKKHGAVIRVRDRHRDVGLRFPAPLDKQNIRERRNMTEILYSGKWLPDIMDHCPDRDYDVRGLAAMIRVMA